MGGAAWHLLLADEASNSRRVQATTAERKGNQILNFPGRFIDGFLFISLGLNLEVGEPINLNLIHPFIFGDDETQENRNGPLLMFTHNGNPSSRGQSFLQSLQVPSMLCGNIGSPPSQAIQAQP